jgi:hypothetical protein
LDVRPFVTPDREALNPALLELAVVEDHLGDDVRRDPAGASFLDGGAYSGSFGIGSGSL